MPSSHPASRDVGVVIAAAGSGNRFGNAKQFELLGDLPMYQYVVRTFSKVESVRSLVIVGREEDVPIYEAGLHDLNLQCHWRVIPGGVTRSESVAKGLEIFSQLDGIEVLLIHDAARALVDVHLIEAVIDAVRKYGSAIPALPVVDTLKRTVDDKVIETVSREHLWRAQTPQGARFELMLRAFDVNPQTLVAATDESQLLERLGEHPRVVPGNESNFKVTYIEDLERARNYVQSRG